MKVKLYFIIIAVFLLNSCKKQNAEDNTSTSLYGKWKFVNSVGGVGGFKITEADLGYSQLMELTTDNQQLYYKNNVFQSQRGFTITKIKSSNSADSISFLNFSATEQLEIMKLNRDSLVISDLFPDGFTTLYIRKK